MNYLTEVQFIPATGQPEYAVVPYPVYLDLKKSQESLKVSTVQPPSTLRPEGNENPIKYWRLSRGLSQKSLAELAEISIPYLSQLEHNVRVGSKSVLKRLAEALNLAVDQIL